MRGPVFDPDVSRRFCGRPLAVGRGLETGYTPPPVVVSYFDPRTGEPCDSKPEPLHGAGSGARRMGKKAKYDEARKRAGASSAARAAAKRKRPDGAGSSPKPVMLDGVRYASMRAAAAAAGGTQRGLSHALNGGAKAYKGHEVAWA